MFGCTRKPVSLILTVLALSFIGCSSSESVSDAGCIIDGGAGDSGPCGTCRFYYDDNLCGLTPPDAGYYPCQQMGDLACYDYCTDSSQCKDSNRPNCSVLGLFNGGDYNCNKPVKVCRAKKDDDCATESVDGGMSISSLRTELERNKAKWAGSGIKNYSYLLTVGCFCGYYEYNPVLVSVRGGETVSVVSKKNGQDASKYYTSYDSADRLFGTIGKELDYAEEIFKERGYRSDKDVLLLEFDSSAGVPILYHFDAAQVADEQISIAVTDFKETACTFDDYLTMQQVVEKKALDYAHCSVDGDCTIYQVDLSCAPDTDVAVSKAELDAFKEALKKTEDDFCNVPCPLTNGSEPISVGCVDGTCKITQWGI